MIEKKQTAAKHGRPRSEETHQAIIKATTQLMETTPIRIITMGAIAKTANVGKPTLYRWWDNKCSLIMDVFLTNVQTEISVGENLGTTQALSSQLESVMNILRGRSGKIVAEMIGEGQSDPHILEEFRHRFFNQFLKPARQIIDQGKTNGNIDDTIDTDLILDLIYGPVYYRLLVGHQPLDDAFAKSLIKRVPMALLAAV